MATRREEEFAPLKNATGPDSPATVNQAISDLGVAWLRQAGVDVPAGAGPVEVSPMYALDAAELAAKVHRRLQVTGPTYLE
jgi:UDP-N-acetylglucosamine/UDP-N-acetylgalactosamine diphosphorylase